MMVENRRRTSQAAVGMLAPQSSRRVRTTWHLWSSGRKYFGERGHQVSVTVERWSKMQTAGFCAMEVPGTFTRLFVACEEMNWQSRLSQTLLSHALMASYLMFCKQLYCWPWKPRACVPTWPWTTLVCLSVSAVFEDSLLPLLLPRENKHVCSPHSSLSLFPASLVMPYLPEV